MAKELTHIGGDELMTKVAIVEDNATFRHYLAQLIDRTPDHKCVCACATARLREKTPAVQVIMLTVYKDIKVIFQALKAGACGYVLKRSDEKEVLHAIAEVRAGGAPMTSEIARMVVRSFLEPAAAGAATTDTLSAREMEILALVAEGLSNKEIGARLHISFATVRTHLMHIYEKLHVRCRTEAAAKYLRSNPPAPLPRPSQPI